MSDAKSSHALHFQVKDGVAKLGDFGFARLDSLMTGSTVGTMTHMSPELLEGKQYTFKHDIYSLSILLWEMWYGRHVYSEDEYNTVAIYALLDAIKTGQRPTFSKKFAPVDGIRKLIERCWSEKPEDRPAAHIVKMELKAVFRKLYNEDITHCDRCNI